VLLRVLVDGSAGSADVGGPYEGLEGLGKAAISNQSLGCELVEMSTDEVIRLFAGLCVSYKDSRS
jgi:hypothetical protein